MKKTLIGYLVFVSYNRNEYEMNGIALDEMTLEEFIYFNNKDKVNCKSIEVIRIFNTTPLISRSSEKNDDSVFWFISADIVKTDMYDEFFNAYTR